jgi:ribonuclease P/MRP protein subunit POP5
MEVVKRPKIKPSKREKKRYIVFEIVSIEKPEFKDVKDAILSACLKYLGEFGYTKSRIYVIENLYSKEKRRGMLRVTNKSIEGIKSVLGMIKKINNQDITLRLLGISGILKKAKNKFLLKESPK